MYQTKLNNGKIITRDDLEDILSAFLESGISDWWCLENTDEKYVLMRESLYMKTHERPTYSQIVTELLLGDEYFIILEYDEAEDDYTEVYQVTLDKVINGINKAVEEEYWDGEDTCDVDAEIADVIMQYAIFDELVYG